MVANGLLFRRELGRVYQRTRVSEFRDIIEVTLGSVKYQFLAAMPHVQSTGVVDTFLNKNNSPVFKSVVERRRRCCAVLCSSCVSR